MMSTSPFGKTNQTCERNGKLTIYIIETTKKLANWPELLKSRLVLCSVNYFRMCRAWYLLIAGVPGEKP